MELGQQRASDNQVMRGSGAARGTGDDHEPKLASLNAGRAVGASNFTTFVVPFGYEPSDGADSAPRVAGLSLVEKVFGTPDTGSKADPRDPLVRRQLELWNHQRLDYFTGDTRGLMYQIHREDESEQAQGARPSTGKIQAETRWFCPAPDDPALMVHVHGYSDLQCVDLTASVETVLFDFPGVLRAKNHRDVDKDQASAVTRIGFTLLHVRMPDSDNVAIDQMLDFNETFRFIRYPYMAKRQGLSDRGCSATCGPASPDALAIPGFRITGLPGSARANDAPFNNFDNPLWSRLATIPIQTSDGKRWQVRPDFSVYPDNRAFVVSHMTVAPPEWSLEINSWLWHLWHQFLYVENSSRNYRDFLTPLEDRWVRSRTYFRWAESPGDGRLFGYSDYSACSLCKQGAFDLATDHFHTIYLDQLLLVMYQRVTTFSFSRKLAEVTQTWKASDWKDTRLAFHAIRERFAQFVNMYWYPTLTHQVQGLEMFALVRSTMDHCDLLDELRFEMQSTWEYMEGKAQDEALNRAENINRIVGVFAPLTLIVGFFSMVFWTGDFSFAIKGSWLLGVVLIALGFASFGYWLYRKKREKGDWKGSVWLILAVMLFAAYVVLVLSERAASAKPQHPEDYAIVGSRN
jgi:hypothetical protein